MFTVAYPGNTAAATLPAGDATLTATDLTANAGVTLGVATLTQYQPNEVWTATHASTQATLAAAVTNGGYHFVTLSRAGGMVLNAIRLKAARGGASTPRGFGIRSSVDGYTADLLTTDVASQRATLTQYSASITGLGTQTSVTFRIYHYGPAATAAVDFDDLEIDYDVAVADTTAPTVPAGVTATANSSTQVTVSWTASTDAVGVASYRVRRGGVDVAGATAVTGTSAVVTGLTASTAYSFTVSAVDAAGNRSAESTAANVTTPATPSLSKVKRLQFATANVPVAGGLSVSTGALASPVTPGSVLIAAFATDKDAGTFTPPAGWTVLANQPGTSVSILVCGLVADGTVNSATASCSTSVTYAQAIILEYGGVNASDPFGPSHLPAYSDTPRTSMVLDPPAAEAAGAALAFLAIDSVATDAFTPASAGFSLIATLFDSSNGSSSGFAALEDLAVSAGEDLASTFTWIRSDQVSGFVVLLNESNPPISTLTDDFATKDTTKWSWGAAASVVSGQVQAVSNASFTGYIRSAARYDLTGGACRVQVAQRAPAGNGGNETFIQLRSGTNSNATSFVYSLTGPTLTCQVRNAAGAASTLASLAYDATTHAWWRFREAGGTVFYDTSPDAVTWTQRASAVPDFPVTAMDLTLGVGFTGTEPTPGAAVFDNVNVAAPDTTAPTVPAGVTATANSSTQVTVSWTASTDAVGVASYRVRRGGVDVAGATAVTGTSAVVTGLTASTAYSFTVSAVDAAGNRSAESTAANVTTPAAPDSTAPTVPTGVTATANSSTQVTVAWTASTDAVGVASYRVRQGGVDVAGATAVTGTSAVVTGLTASTAYSFTVSAVDAAGNRSAESTAANVTTPAPDTTAPTVPTGVSATVNSSTQITVAWTASTDAVGVASYRVRQGGVDVAGATAVTGTSFAVTALTPTTTYTFTVSAVDAAGNRSAESTAATATTPAAVLPPAPTPAPAQVTSPWAGEPRRMTVSVYTGDYQQRLGQVPDYISCSVTWQHLGVGSGELVVGEDDPIASYLLVADSDIVPVVVNLGTIRWSGRVSAVTLERDGPVGSGQLTATLVDDWTWLQRMLASQGGASTSLTGMPQFDARTGPAVSVAADYINAAASRLAVPVRASKPSVDTSPSVTLSARMTPLADLLLEPLKAAGVTMTAQIWLPSDPQPPDMTSTLTAPTVVFRPRVLPDKPWLQWTDAMTNIARMTFQANQPTAYRTVVGLSGTDAARVYDQVIDTVRRTDLGLFGLPEIHTDASDAALGTPSQNAGREALAQTGGVVAASFQVADANPWTFGQDYVVGDLATLVVNGASWRQRITQVTASDSRSDGLVFTPVVGDKSPDVTGNDMMVRALARVAEGLRTLQAGR